MFFFLHVSARWLLNIKQILCFKFWISSVKAEQLIPIHHLQKRTLLQHFSYLRYVCHFLFWSKWDTCVYWWISADETFPIIFHHQSCHACLCGRVAICVRNSYFYHKSQSKAHHNSACLMNMSVTVRLF